MKFFLIMAAATMLQLPLENNETCEQAFDRYVYYIDNKNHQPMESRIFILYDNQHVVGYYCKYEGDIK